MKFTYYECLTTQWALQRNIKEIARLLKNIYDLVKKFTAFQTRKKPDKIELLLFYAKKEVFKVFWRRSKTKIRNLF